jgi:phage terminase small subunit
LADIEAIKLDAMQKVADRDGNMGMANHTAALKAAELQGKHLGIFKDKLEVSGANGGPVQNVTMTPSDFKDIAKGILKDI